MWMPYFFLVVETCSMFTQNDSEAVHVDNYALYIYWTELSGKGAIYFSPS